jgi:hypothetical protein
MHLPFSTFDEYLDDFVVYYIHDILFSPRKWKTVDTTYLLFWTTLGKFDFTSNWKYVNFIKLKWSYWATSVLKMAFTRVPIYFTLDDVFSQLGEDYPFHLTNFVLLKKIMLKLITRFLTQDF